MKQDFVKNNLPEAPLLKNIIGPSFILLGLGLGSGELILWPYLVSNWGMGVIWGAVLGVTMQFFINMEIERYALARGESVFVGFARIYKFLPYWFILSTFIAWIWPGIISVSARLIGEMFGLTNYNLIGILLLILIGIILTVGKVLYRTVERISLFLIIIGVPIIFFFALYFASPNDWMDMAKGFMNFGGIPDGLPIASFLAAFAFAGAGGNLNLAQSFYIKEKGYGMGKYGGKITSILSGEVKDLKLEGSKFSLDNDNLKKFNKWWKLVNIEHFIIFWFGGVLTICMLSLLAYSTVYGTTGLQNNVLFILEEARFIGLKLGTPLGLLFMSIGGFMLFNTQLTVFDATSRIMAENYLILKNKGNLPKVYYFVLWSQILIGVVIFMFDFAQPLLLLTVSALLNALAMFVHIGFTLILNIKELDKELRPNLFRISVVVISLLFFGYFSLKTILSL